MRTAVIYKTGVCNREKKSTKIVVAHTLLFTVKRQCNSALLICTIRTTRVTSNMLNYRGFKYTFYFYPPVEVFLFF